MEEFFTSDQFDRLRIFLVMLRYAHQKPLSDHRPKVLGLVEIIVYEVYKIRKYESIMSSKKKK